jgi:hypothetical protein
MEPPSWREIMHKGIELGRSQERMRVTGLVVGELERLSNSGEYTDPFKLLVRLGQAILKEDSPHADAQSAVPERP